MSIKKIILIGLLCTFTVGCATQSGISRDDTAYTGSSPQELYNTGNRYAKGIGVERNYAKAVTYFQRSADGGNSNAQASLGVRYMSGQGVPQNYDIAKSWFEKAAAQNNPYAENQLGYMYASGRCDTRLWHRISWYQKHPIMDTSAQYNLS